MVLWLGTMLNEPPVESVNVTWRNSGFATYLLCLLIKQHTGISDDMSKSTLSIQASPIASNDACRFYQRLGFSRYEKDDNGFSQTSAKFQSAVKRHPYFWIPSSSQAMAFFQLYGGRIMLPTIGIRHAAFPEGEITDLTYAHFPFCVPSMEKLEQCIEKNHLISFLSGEGLP